MRKGERLLTAVEFVNALDVIRRGYLKEVPKREIFSLAKEFQYMPVNEVVKLLQNENGDLRLGAVAILDWKARNNKTSAKEREEIFRAYIDNHHWINEWGLVDRAAPYVVGGYLFDKNRKLLYDFTKSGNPMERRTAIVSTYYFILKNDIEDTFKIAELLINDSDEYVQKAVGSWIREAGKKNEEKLIRFLDKYAVDMPRMTLRYAIEKLDKKTRELYLYYNKKTTDRN